MGTGRNRRPAAPGINACGGGGIQMSGTAKAVQCLIKLGTTSLPRPIQMTEATGDLWSPFKIRGGPTTN